LLYLGVKLKTMENQQTTLRPRSGKILAGFILIAAGTILLFHQLGYFFPSWLISWPMILIVVSLVIGAKNQFANSSWLLPFAVGIAFLVDRALPSINISRYIAPAAIIALGVWVMFGKSHRFKSRKWREAHQRWEQSMAAVEIYNNTNNTNSKGEFLEAVSVFGGSKKTVFSKNFTGGDVVTFIGGVEINLVQADIQGRVVLEVTQVLGGTKVIVPAHWDVVSEIAAVFGGIEDKRVQHSSQIQPDKILILRGTSVFGGIEIQSFG
jgi:predicted membrane protein